MVLRCVLIVRSTVIATQSIRIRNCNGLVVKTLEALLWAVFGFTVMGLAEQIRFVQPP